MNGLKIVFAGTPAFALPCLDALLHSSNEIAAVYTQPDRPAGRGRKLQTSAVKQWAEKYNIQVCQPLNFKSPEAIEQLRAFKPDLMIVIAYGLILPKSVLTIPRLGCVNVHASLLPNWRGASPIQQAVLHGDAISGVTIMQMDVGMDTGDSLATISCPLSADETTTSLHDKLAGLAAEPLLKTIEALNKGTAVPIPQLHEAATYAGKINKEDALINWNQPAIHIDRLIRAYNPWPIAYTHCHTENMRIYEAKISTQTSKEVPGTILSISNEGLLVATADKAIEIQSLQFPGGKAILVADCLIAIQKRLSVGMVLE